jgi:predicted nucleic acid-binding protein
MIRVVIDTNIVVSALLQPSGLPAQVFVLALSGSIQMFVSGSIYAEYEEVISRPRFQLDQETIERRSVQFVSRALGLSLPNRCGPVQIPMTTSFLNVRRRHGRIIS